VAKGKKQKVIDFNFSWSLENLPMWIFFLYVEEQDRIDTGFEWVFRIQGLGFQFEWVKECKYADVRAFRSSKRNHVTQNDV
jgi:hypothetical protein